jgi:hypothetical protein
MEYGMWLQLVLDSPLLGQPQQVGPNLGYSGYLTISQELINIYAELL